MTDINILFFELIQVAIGTRIYLSHTPSADDWGELFAMAMKQSLVGVCFAGVQKASPQPSLEGKGEKSLLLRGDLEEAYIPEMLYLTWMGMAAKIQQRNETVNRQCVELQAKLSADGIRSCIFKGQGVASLYKFKGESLKLIDLSSLRQSGDIDLYVDCGRERTLEYLQGLGMNGLEWDYVHTHAPFFEDTEVEVHYRAGAVRNLWKNRRLQRFWKENEEEFFGGEAQLGSGRIVCPTKRMHLFYLIHHTYRHLISGGIGLRQMMDVYFALQNRDRNDDEWLKENVNAFGMTEFAEAMSWVMREVFGMGMIGMPWIPNDRKGRFLLNEIMIGGNFGKDDKRFGEGCSKLAMLTQIAKRNCHLASHYGNDALAAPFYYIWHFCWKRIHKGLKI